ncbi:MAG: glycosyltransferase family 4 protein [Lachnospiraceae bacterium]|nr:glycosyltransferase family 4 protein [Lachnospiraceae bacterium]
MKVITLLTAGHIGGIETLCMDYARLSSHDNVMLILWGDGHVDELMRQQGTKVINLHASHINVHATVGRVMQIIRDEQADVLIAQHSAPMSHLCLMRAKKLFPQIHTIAYAQVDAYDMIAGAGKFRMWLRKTVLRASFKRADDVVAISQSVKKSLDTIFGIHDDRIRIIYNAVDLKNFPFSERRYDSDICELIYTGRLVPEKGVQLTLRALGQVSDNHRFRLRIAGDGDYREELTRLAEELGISDIVEFLGSRDDVPELLKQSDVFIHMPIWAEGFGISVAEAMSTGCICICASNGAMPELITDGIDGFLVGKEDVSGLASTLERVYSLSVGEKKRLSQAARNKAGQFSTDIFVEKLDELASRMPDS